MEYSIWNAQILFPDNPRLPTVTPHNVSIIEFMFCPSREKRIFHQITLNEFEKELLCKCL